MGMMLIEELYNLALSTKIMCFNNIIGKLLLLYIAFGRSLCRNGLMYFKLGVVSIK